MQNINILSAEDKIMFYSDQRFSIKIYLIKWNFV